MRKIVSIIVYLAMLVLLSDFAVAAQRTTKEREVKQQQQKQQQQQTSQRRGPGVSGSMAATVRQLIINYLKGASTAAGTFDIYDPKLNKVRHLSFVSLNERVGKMGNIYYACALLKTPLQKRQWMWM